MGADVYLVIDTGIEEQKIAEFATIPAYCSATLNEAFGGDWGAFLYGMKAGDAEIHIHRAVLELRTWDVDKIDAFKGIMFIGRAWSDALEAIEEILAKCAEHPACTIRVY